MAPAVAYVYGLGWVEWRRGGQDQLVLVFIHLLHGGRRLLPQERQRGPGRAAELFEDQGGTLVVECFARRETSVAVRGGLLAIERP